jgi:hypothetical protein
METIDKPEVKQMKKFVIREAETLKTTRASYYGSCCCRIC